MPQDPAQTLAQIETSSRRLAQLGQDMTQELTQLLMADITRDIRKTETDMREIAEINRNTIAELRRERIPVDDEGWRAIKEMARLDRDITALNVAAAAGPSLLARQLAQRSRTMLDETRRSQITDEQWIWLLKLIALDTLTSDTESAADRIRAYLAGAPSVDAICATIERANRDTLELKARMDEIKRSL
jgi:hypothetical protein